MHLNVSQNHFNSLLIMPIQRGPRYEYLFPSFHPMERLLNHPVVEIDYYCGNYCHELPKPM